MFLFFLIKICKDNVLGNKDMHVFFIHRRRLSTILVRLKFAEHMKEAVTYIEQGHIRVGPDTVVDPAFLVTRNMEDFITWVDTSKIRRKVLEYNDQLDDYDAMN